ncbi:MAG: hypothetical protein KDC85_10605 [Saprospiraceae bacterium]|nr:hypothetical protein [Saprospiraceae bacterium]
MNRGKNAYLGLNCFTSKDHILKIDNDRRYFRLMQFGVFFIFLGRAWQHWFYEAPYRELLWDQGRMEWIIHKFLGLTWTEWVTNPQYDAGITSFINGMGIFYLLCALSVLGVKKYPKITSPFIITGGISLIFLAGLYFKQKLYTPGEFIEYTLQFSSPFILWHLVKSGGLTPRLVMALKIAVALTFVGHGLYAVNYYPRPANFLVMCMNILPINEDQAANFLSVVGTLDFISVLLIFLPFRKAVLVGLIYASIWGVATALARPWAYFYWIYWEDSLHRWLFEAAFRLIHGLGPFVLLLYYWKGNPAGKSIDTIHPGTDEISHPKL